MVAAIRNKNRPVYSTEQLNNLFFDAVAGCRESSAHLYYVSQRLITKNFKRHLNEDDLEDLLQNTYCKIIKTNKFDASKSCFASWLLLLAKQECFDMLRKKYRQNKKLHNFAEEHCEVAHFTKTFDDLFVDETIKKVLQICAETHPELQPFFYLHFYKGLTIDQCSLAMKIPIGTLKSRARRIYIKLESRIRE